MTVQEYQTPVDIANVACQHLGVDRITAFDDDSKQASELAFRYDKVRAAELRRNLWVFSTKKAAIRAADTSTRTWTPPVFSGMATYPIGAVVSQDGLYWQSRIAANLNNTPGFESDGIWEVFFGSRHPDAWDQKTAYFAGELVYTPVLWVSTTSYSLTDQVIADGIGYQSLINNNVGLTPSANPSAWEVVTPTFVHYLSLQSNNSDFPLGSSKWVAINGTSLDWSPLWPVGSGPSSQTVTLNVYPLPYGFLCEAPQDPKAGSNGYLGAPSGQQYSDWTYNSTYITTIETQPIVLRFGANITNVNRMDPMFCEGLAARLAIECCEPITQSEGKLKAAWLSYNTVMKEARMVNGIEQGPTEPPIDEYISVRL